MNEASEREVKVRNGQNFTKLFSKCSDCRNYKSKCNGIYVHEKSHVLQCKKGIKFKRNKKQLT